MKIVDNRAQKIVRFADLSLGMVYADTENNICIKISEAEYDENCLTLREDTWYAETASAKEIVTVLNAKLVIEN